VPLLAEELKDSLTALQLRGVIIEELKFKKRFSLYTYLLLPAIVSSLRHAKELAMSMEMRAFRAMSRRTSYFTLKINKSDVFLLITLILASAALAFTVFNYNFFEIIMEVLGNESP
jgi:energy-coupling factor transport system permease protein